MAFKTETYYKKIEDDDFKDGVLTIPEGYLEVSRTIFDKCDRKYKNLKKVILSSTIKTIKPGCFSGRRHLETVVLNEGLETINEEAFKNCIRLKEINFPSSLIKIGTEAFYMCESLVSIKLHDNVYLSLSCFTSCHKLETVELGSIPRIPGYAFSDTTVLNKIDVSKVKEIGQFSFAASGVKELIFKELEFLHYKAFYKANEISHLEIPLNTSLNIGNNSIGDKLIEIPEVIAKNLNMNSKIPVEDFQEFLTKLHMFNDKSGNYDGAMDAFDSGLFSFKMK